MLRSSSRSALWLMKLANILLGTNMSVWKPQTGVKLHIGVYYLEKTCKCGDRLVPLPLLSVLLLIHVGQLYCQGGRGKGKNQCIAAHAVVPTELLGSSICSGLSCGLAELPAKFGQRHLGILLRTGLLNMEEQSFSFFLFKLFCTLVHLFLVLETG